MKKLEVILLALAILLVAGNASAQSPASYPTRHIQMIIPYEPGGSSDFAGRILQRKLTEVLGQQVLVINRPGAAGNIGVEATARATPDGYTMLLANLSNIAINPSVFPKFPIKPLRDLIGITAVVDTPLGLAIHPSIPATTIKDFISYAKARPGQLNYSSSSISAPSRLAFEFLMAKSGITLVNVPYKGGAGAATIGLLSGEVSVTLSSVTPFIPQVKSGKLKVIGVMAEKRLAFWPDIPTFAESGFPELTFGTWQGVFVPVGTPKPIVDKLFSALSKAMNDPQVIESLAKGATVPFTSKSPEDFAVFIKSQDDFWAKLVKQLGIEEN